MSLAASDLERAVAFGARVTRGAACLALVPVRVALRAVRPSRPRPPEPARPPAPPPPTPLRPDVREPRPAGAGGPGPEVRVEEPWEGYDAMNVADVLRRLTFADGATRAMVRLYEETHKRRKGVLRATG